MRRVGALQKVWALPTIWLMTDERLGDALWPAIMALPRGAGIVFRHHATDLAARRILFARIRKLAQRRGLVLIRAGAWRMPGEHGVHNHASPGLRSAAVHSLAEGIAARRLGAELVFISPLFATRSHPGAAALGPLRAATIARHVGLSAIALGGMNARRFRRLKALGFHGWAGIDAWTVQGVSTDRR
jgi:thiamine-phosphate pyrophosphorylase